MAKKDKTKAIEDTKKRSTKRESVKDCGGHDCGGSKTRNCGCGDGCDCPDKRKK